MAAVSRENWVERIRDPKIECMSSNYRDGRSSEQTACRGSKQSI